MLIAGDNISLAGASATDSKLRGTIDKDNAILWVS